MSMATMATMATKSNKYVLFNYIGVFETEPVNPDIFTVIVQQLLYDILWLYGGTTTESNASH